MSHQKKAVVMIYTHAFPKGKKCKVWLDELPDTALGPLFLDARLPVQNAHRINNRKIAMELVTQRHISSYGMLGLEWTALPTSNNADVNVHYNNAGGRIFTETSAHNRNTVLAVMPEEYAEAVLQAAAAFVQSCPCFPSGRLAFTVGTHCLVGSSKALFRALTHILLICLVSNRDMRDARALETLLDSLLVF